MSRVERLHREKVTRYSIRKYSFGAASVAVAALFMFLGNGAVSANELSKQDTPSVEAPALNKTQLESYISEIETKLSNGSYDNKTEESVAVLKSDLEAAKATLANATTQAQLTEAYNKLVTTVSSKLKNKPVEKKETPAVDTTEGKPTVGKKAENTEKKSDSNSIENTGSNDPRNGKEMDKENALRTETSKTVDNITYTAEFSNDTTKEIYVYNKEEANVEFKINSSTNKVTYAEVTQASNQKFKTVNDTTVTDGYGYNFNKITTETDTPLTVRMTGQPNDFIMSQPNYNKTEDQNFAMGDRYLRIIAKDGSTMSTNSSGANADGYFRIVLKSQTYKYSIKLPESNADKIGVNDINSLTPADIDKIKNEIKIQYSEKATTQDARLASHKGEVLADRSSVVKDVAVANGTVTVTYQDDSVDTAPVSSVARTNEAPTVEIPYSDPAAKEIYVYAGEENSFDIKFKDDSGKISSAIVNGGGNQPFKAVDGQENQINTQYGFTANKITAERPATADEPAVITYRGTPAATDGLKPEALEAATKGDKAPGMVLGWRYATATDADGAEITNRAVGSSNATDPGSFRVMLKPQTQKYDVTEPTAKVTVADPNSLSETDLQSIKNNLKLVYSTTNNDARLASVSGSEVTNPTSIITDVKQDPQDSSKLVVTYADGSTDKIDKSKFIKGGPAPTVNTTIKASGSIPDSVPSSDSELTGTGTPGATVKVTVKNPETGAVISEKTAVVGEDGTWKLPLEEGLNSNTQLPGASEAARRFFAPKNPVEITQVVNGIETESRAVSVAVGESKILPSAAAKDGKSVVAGAKEVTITVPHDAGRSYFFYTNKGATSTTEVALEQSQNGWSIIKNGDKATIKSVEKGVSVHTITLTMNENALFQEGDNKLEIISHNGPSSPPSRLGRYKINVTNEKPTLASKNAQPETTVNVGDTVDPVSLVTAADHEDDKDATLGTKVRAEVISVNGDESVKTVDTTTAGRYEVKYKAVDSQGKESDVLTHTVIVQGPAPTVEAPYSNQANKQIYVYTGENTDLTFKGADENEVKDLYLRGPGDISKDNTTDYGFTTGKITDGTVTTGVGEVSADKRTATVKMTGKTNLAAGKEWTSFVVSKDNDGKLSNTDYRAIDVDPNAKEKPGYVRFVVKNQTSKYDIATPTEKVAVTDPANVTEDDLAKIKEKLQLEYNKNNDDANISKDSPVTDKDSKIKSLTKDADGNLVVTYTDGSTDKRPLSDFVAKNPAVTPVKDPANLTDAEKTKVEEAVKKANPTATKVEVGNDGTATVTFPDGSTAEIPAAKAVEKAKDAEGVKDPEVTPVKDPANLTDAEKAKVAEEVKKSNPTAKDVEVGKDGTVTVTFPDGSTTTVTPDKTVKSADSNGAKDPSVTPVKDPANLTDAEKAKVVDEVKKSNPTAKDVEVGKDGTVTVTFPDGSTAVIPAAKAVAKAKDSEGVQNPSKPATDAGKNTPVAQDQTAKPANKSKDSEGVKAPSATSVKDPSNLTDAEKAKVADEVKKSNPTATDVKVGKDGTTTVSFPDGSTAVIPADKAVAKANDSEGVQDPSATAVKDPSNLTDADKAKAASKASQTTSAQANARKGAKELPNTGTADSTVAMVAAAASALLGLGLGLAGRRRKEDEEA